MGRGSQEAVYCIRPFLGEYHTCMWLFILVRFVRNTLLRTLNLYVLSRLHIILCFWTFYYNHCLRCMVINPSISMDKYVYTVTHNTYLHSYLNIVWTCSPWSPCLYGKERWSSDYLDLPRHISLNTYTCGLYYSFSGYQERESRPDTGWAALQSFHVWDS